MRIGLIGAGAVADFHIQAARSIAHAEVTAVCDLDDSAAARAADRAGDARVFADYREMYASGCIDAVIVNTPHALHLPMVTDAARAGLHVLVEKPMATTLADCDVMIAACENADVALAVGHIQHYMPDKLAAKAIIDSGELGDVVMIHDDRSTDYRPGTRPDWFLSRDVAGGGALINIGGHCLDRCLWFGGAHATELFASTVQRFGADVETDGMISLRLKNGVGVTISVLSDPPSKTDSMSIVCELGVVVADPRRGTTVQRDGTSRMLHSPDPGDIQRAFTAQLADFLAVIAGAEPAVPLSHARHVVELVLASYRSEEQHSLVALESEAVEAGAAR
ncbi:Gfo/Idh/MocA family protein [Paramicrobacterium fandaimingii]|uniref:Gfo/Idh/MocA family protein n=1 Tax=Paramicrobacterium fandaimingii TaxID=2708079 RepID=UPI001424762F|nr:Gfo/Idh/MocA family oxidoreductase [Microbacterium fandaimingii]